MLIWMEHPYHGKLPIYSIQEFERHKQLGWSEVKTEPAPAPVSPLTAMDDSEPDDYPSIPAQPPGYTTLTMHEHQPRRGRPPGSKNRPKVL